MAARLYIIIDPNRKRYRIYGGGALRREAVSEKA